MDRDNAASMTGEATTGRIRTRIERTVKALELRPAVGQGTAVTRVRVRSGLACDIEDGSWKLVSDMTRKGGGADEGPNPGVLGRAALGSCLAIGYAMWAARLDVPLESLEVEVQADYDARGMYGVGDVSPGYTEIRCIVTVESGAPDEDVRRVLDQADAHSDYLALYRDPQEIRREVRINPDG